MNSITCPITTSLNTLISHLLTKGVRAGELLHGHYKITFCTILFSCDMRRCNKEGERLPGVDVYRSAMRNGNEGSLIFNTFHKL